MNELKEHKIIESNVNYKQYFDKDYAFYKQKSSEKVCKFRYNYVKKYTRDKSLSESDKKPLKKILDVGCGKAKLVEYFRNNGHDAYGIDISNYAINNCYPGAKGYVFPEDICKIGRFKENEFDTVMSWAVLHTIPPDKRSLAVENMSFLANNYIIVRLFVKGSMVVPKNKPYWFYRDHIHDGAPIYLETSYYWIELFERFGKFRLYNATCSGYFLQDFYAVFFGKEAHITGIKIKYLHRRN